MLIENKKIIRMKYFITLLSILLIIDAYATEVLTGTISSSISKCEDITTQGPTVVSINSDLSIISNVSVGLKTGFETKANGGYSLKIQIDADNCCKCEGAITDLRDNQIYSTVKIFDQVWMAENLDYDATISVKLEHDGIDYGRLYRYVDYMNGSTEEGAQGFCPTGWHIPTLEELYVLLLNYSDPHERYNALIEGGSSGFDTKSNGFAYFIIDATGNIYIEGKYNSFFGSSTINESYNGVDGLYLERDAFWLTNDQEAHIVGTGQYNWLSIRCLKNCSRSKAPSEQKSTLSPIKETMDSRMETLSMEKNTQLYPNPNKGQFALTIDKPMHVQIYTTDGELIYTDMLSSGKNLIDISSEPSGIYLIRFNNKNTTSVDRIVKW